MLTSVVAGVASTIVSWLLLLGEGSVFQILATGIVVGALTFAAVLCVIISISEIVTE